MLECFIDGGDNYVAVSDELVTSPGTEQCLECKQLIHVGVPHYRVREWGEDEDGEEVTQAQHCCCEECGDLAISFLALGYCWSYGCLRADIREMNENL